MTISKRRLTEIAAVPDEEIDTSEIPEIGEEQFKRAKLVLPDDPQSPKQAYGKKQRS